MHLVASQVVGVGLVLRSAEKGGELGDLADIIALGMVAQPADGHVPDHRCYSRQTAGRVLVECSEASMGLSYGRKLPKLRRKVSFLD